MEQKKTDAYKIWIAGLSAGLISGLLGTGGGTVLIPQLSNIQSIEPEHLFSNSVAIILPICVTVLGVTAAQTGLPWAESIPYLLGSAIGGILAFKLGKRIPLLWLHRVFGTLILVGGIRTLW